ncbi:unnamed protein product [Mytilus coruscus]|uniref:MEGF10_11 n=1 Tax=Mytilus coruscus TaxID=42192 RepID=A0A6J8BIM9_MYTCO|nr:unnamed protein product [Mytilus coruscus]
MYGCLLYVYEYVINIGAGVIKIGATVIKNCATVITIGASVIKIGADVSCPQGKFGWKCQFRCGCKNNATCNPITGSCPDGFNSFIYDPHGRLYTGTMYRTESGKPCQQWKTSIFKNMFNYTGKCIAGKDGTNCSETCGKCKDIVCDHDTGHCLNEWNAGWKGDRYRANISVSTDISAYAELVLEYAKIILGKHLYCSFINVLTECETGTYGSNCSMVCGECKDIVCDRETGQYLNGCNAGWKGDHCNIKCENGKYGTNYKKRVGNVRIFGVMMRLENVWMDAKLAGKETVVKREGTRSGSATFVSKIPPEVQYDDIETIYDNSMSVPVLLNNVQDVETMIVDETTLERKQELLYGHENLFYMQDTSNYIFDKFLY